MLRIALAQINPVVGDLKGNHEKIAEYLFNAKEQDADIVVFPELAVCGYPPEDLLYKRHFIEDQKAVLKSLIKQASKITTIIGFVDIDKKGHLYNAAAIINNGRLIDIYHKQALPNYGVFDEKRYFQSGRDSKIYSLNNILFGVNICEDIWINEGPCKDQAKMGAQILINISSSPYDVDKIAYKERLLKQRAKESKASVCYVNQVGGQDELIFDGCSMIIDSKGKVLASGKEFEEDLIVADLDVLPAKAKGRSKNTILLQSGFKKEKTSIKKHIVSPSTPLERIYKALILGTRDYIRKNGFQKILIGLSGGIDSSLVAAIAVEAIGKDNVVGVTMPTRYSSQGTRSDAKRLADNLGIKFIQIPIENIFKVYLQTLEGEFKGLKSNIAEENIQARVRGNILMALSNKFGWLVLTTGNKSEFAVGYCTLYGDMSGGFAVIKDIPKTKVYELSALINSYGREIIPQSVIDRPPTAELRENQKDQDSLPPYNVLDGILEGYVENHQSIKKMSRKYSEDLVKKVIDLVDKSEYKRRQSPPGIKITQRAFGKDWRLPITNKYKEFHT